MPATRRAQCAQSEVRDRACSLMRIFRASITNPSTHPWVPDTNKTPEYGALRILPRFSRPPFFAFTGTSTLARVTMPPSFGPFFAAVLRMAVRTRAITSSASAVCNEVQVVASAVAAFFLTITERQLPTSDGLVVCISHSDSPATPGGSTCIYKGANGDHHAEPDQWPGTGPTLPHALDDSQPHEKDESDCQGHRIRARMGEAIGY